MKSLVNEIFNEYGYIANTETDGNKINYEMLDKADYYICCFCDGKIELRKYCEQIEAEFADEMYYMKSDNSARKKNTSIIFFVEVENVKEFEEDKQKQLYDIEESPYYLKKYVLVYNKEQIEEFKNSTSIDGNGQLLSIKKKMEIIISDVDKYRSSKTSRMGSLYDMVLKLYAKIPFTSYDVIPVIHISESMSKIDEKINKKESEHVRQLYAKYIDDDWSNDKLMQFIQTIEIKDEEIEDYIQKSLNDLGGN